jgi:hypothetical protein
VPVAAAIVPARLAGRYKQVLWRELAGGGLEVAAKEGHRVERLHVYADGSTTPMGASTHRRRLRRTIAFLLPAACGVAVLVIFRFGGLALFVAFVLLLAAHFAQAWVGSLLGHLERELGATYEWHEPVKLHGWTPHTTAQLTAVEKIATEHDGRAFVSDTGAATIEVLTRHHRYVLDTEGQVELHEQTRFRGIRRDKRREWIKIVTWVPGD